MNEQYKLYNEYNGYYEEKDYYKPIKENKCK